MMIAGLTAPQFLVMRRNQRMVLYFSINGL